MSLRHQTSELNALVVAGKQRPCVAGSPGPGPCVRTCAAGDRRWSSGPGWCSPPAPLRRSQTTRTCSVPDSWRRTESLQRAARDKGLLPPPLMHSPICTPRDPQWLQAIGYGPTWSLRPIRINETNRNIYTLPLHVTEQRTVLIIYIYILINTVRIYIYILIPYWYI